MKIPSFLSSRYAVSSIIATVLMLMITTSLSGLAYLYISGTLTRKTAQSFSIISTYKDTVTIQNDGTLPLSSLTATVDGNDVPIAVVPNIGGSVGYWSFNDQNNPTADNSGNGNDGSLSAPNLATNPQFDGVSNFNIWYSQPDFVFGTGSNGIASGWESYIYSTGSAEYAIDNTDYTISTSSQAVKVISNVGGIGVRSNDDISFDETQVYVISVWVKSDVPGTNFNIYVGDPSNPEQNFVLTTTWQQYIFSYTPSVSGSYRVYLRSMSGVGYQFRLDNAQITLGPIWTSGKFGNALEFDGIDDYVKVDHATNLQFGLGDFSLEAWFKSSDTTTDKTIIRKDGNGYYYFTLRSSGELQIVVYKSPNDATVGYDADYNDGEWHHAVAVADRDENLHLYVDDSEVGTPAPMGLVGNINPTNPLYIGARSPTQQFFNGTIDEVRIFSRALSPEEISSLYSGLVSAGQIATVKFLTPLTAGTHTIRLCTPGACQGSYLTIL